MAWELNRNLRDLQVYDKTFDALENTKYCHSHT